MTGKKWVALAAMAAFALPTAALALDKNNDVIIDGNTGAETRTAVVSLADLNLASDKGQRTADSRIDRAAKKVCGFVNGSILPETRDYRNCYGDALDGAREDLNALVARAS